MNVDLPFQHAQHAFLFVLGLIALFTAIFIFFFKRKKWF
jgi:LPXTG-motif cell wall-anchored protein